MSGFFGRLVRCKHCINGKKIVMGPAMYPEAPCESCGGSGYVLERDKQV